MVQKSDMEYALTYVNYTIFIQSGIAVIFLGTGNSSDTVFLCTLKGRSNRTLSVTDLVI